MRIRPGVTAEPSTRNSMSESSSRLVDRILPPFVALAGALAWALCFHGDTGPVVLSWLALAPIVWLLPQRRGFLLGSLHGVIYWLAAVPWVAHAIGVFGGLPRSLALVLLLGLAIYLALYQVVWVFVGRRLLLAGRDHTALFTLPALWVALEWLRGPVLTGFPWNLAAYAWVDFPGALALSSWGGAWLVSFLVVFVNMGVGLAVLRRRPVLALVPALLALLVLAVAGRWAVPEHEAQGSISVRLIQPNTGILDWQDSEAILDAYRELLELSWKACDRPGVLILGPESAAFPFVFERDRRLVSDLDALASKGCSVLLNSIHRTETEVFNSAFLVSDREETGRYDKQHLVPWGEYVPLADFLPFVGTLAREAGNFTAAEELRLLTLGEQKLGVSICFEIVFPDEVVERVREGASILVTLTNDAWYGDSSAPRQHYRAARFRAAETRRTVLRAALTGISAIIAPDGSPMELLPLGEHGILQARVGGKTEVSPFVRRPWLVPSVCSLISLFAILFAFRRRL